MATGHGPSIPVHQVVLILRTLKAGVIGDDWQSKTYQDLVVRKGGGVCVRAGATHLVQR